MIQKGENTSAIYRLKITEKYAFVQTNSKLIKDFKNFSTNITGVSQNVITSLDNQLENETEVILSTHSIIK